MTGHGDLARGMDLLNRQGLNKDTAFTDAERTALGLHGLLPPQVETLEEQSLSAYESVSAEDRRPGSATSICARSRTPTKSSSTAAPRSHRGDDAHGLHAGRRAACQQFSHIYRRPRGLFISYPWRDSIATLLQNRPNPEVDVIVVTDGERIPASATGSRRPRHPIGKLSLYTLVGGIRPSGRCRSSWTSGPTTWSG